MTQIAPNRFPEAHRNGRALMRAIAEAEAEDHRQLVQEPRASIPRWFPFFIAIAVPAGMFCAALLLEWWLS